MLLTASKSLRLEFVRLGLFGTTFYVIVGYQGVEGTDDDEEVS